ncbi:hypothetical protein K2173_011426 [Erythroxylum novogranatense]|uniref:CWF19-like protein 2 n=1 Tax=Erythroxylum novogranatense TaxID=1862640 RepID=A0AAV8TFH8_9ROSI|nr:hypothetical protein K2173_011426 [Erythroxylum novogranatense]
MFSGVKFISRDQIDKEDVRNETRMKIDKKKKKHRREKKSSRYDSNSDDDLERVKKGSRRNKKWYSSDEHTSEDSSGIDSEDSYEQSKSMYKSKGKKKGRDHHLPRDGDSSGFKKRSKNGGEYHLMEDYSSSDDMDQMGWEGGRKKSKKSIDDNISARGIADMEIVRKEMGLDWMLRPADRTDKKPAVTIESKLDEIPIAEMKGVNPRELNPYLKDNGTGYPDDEDEKRGVSSQLPSTALVGDGGASWRLKALRRAQEQAAREGKGLEEIVGERWGSLGHLAVSAASGKAAPSRAHLHAIKNRKKGQTEDIKPESDIRNDRDIDQTPSQRYLKDVSVRHPEMKAPKNNDSLSWGKQKCQKKFTDDGGLISAAATCLNKFANDGSFMTEVLCQQNSDICSSGGSQMNHETKIETNSALHEVEANEGGVVTKEGLSANQLAAKALQLRMKGKHEEAQKLMQEAESMKAKQGAVGNYESSSRPKKIGSHNRYFLQNISSQRKGEDDADRHLAQKIIQNKRYSVSGQADDEYDFDDGPNKKSRKNKGVNDHKVSDKNYISKRILTQQERCLFCFENPSRPKHLVVSIANFTYLMLPQQQSIVTGHCCILPMQHESATRVVDNNVWEELRNFKKCLIMMFSKQDKEVVFLETVMGIAQQRRHCLIECIPLPREIAKQAPLYFKKAIDEAEDEWSQHDAKKLIDTSVKGLRGSIPKNFPYFHVEFGLNSGFVHVIDDEQQFKSSLGLNVIRGMLRLPEEDMYRRRRHESVEAQKQAVASFARDWEPFDWTKQLE